MTNSSINARLDDLVIEAHRARKMSRSNMLLTAQAALRVVAQKARDIHEELMQDILRENAPTKIAPLSDDSCTCPACSEDALHQIRPLTLMVKA